MRCILALGLVAMFACDDAASTEDGEGPDRTRVPATDGGGEELRGQADREGEPLDVSYTLLPLYAEAESSGTTSRADAGSAQDAGVRVVDPTYDDCEALPVSEDCDANTAPVLRDPLYVVNDLLVPDLSDVRNGDRITVLVAFSDAQCDLACGTNWSSSESETGNSTSAGSLPDNIPCSTEEDGVHLGLYVSLASLSGPGIADRPPEHHRYRLGVTDRCGGRSEPQVVEFDVTF